MNVRNKIDKKQWSISDVSGRIIKPYRVFYRSLRYWVNRYTMTQKPRSLVIRLTKACNAQCCMCNLWAQNTDDEMSLSEIEKCISNPVFSKIKGVIFAGGEVILRKDLPDIISSVLKFRDEPLTSISIASNGYNTELLKIQLEKILSMPCMYKVQYFNIGISLDGPAEIHDSIRNVPGLFERVIKSIQMIKDLQKRFPLNLIVKCTIQKKNVYKLNDLIEISEKEQFSLGFSNVENLLTNFSYYKNYIELNQKEFIYFKNFYNSVLKKKLSIIERMYWEQYMADYSVPKKKRPCCLPYDTFILDSKGEVLPCGMHDSIIMDSVFKSPPDAIWKNRKQNSIRKKLLEEICPSCISSVPHNQTVRLELIFLLTFYFNVKLRELWDFIKTLRLSL